MAPIPRIHTSDDEDEGDRSELLEPHSGWGRCAGSDLIEHSGYLDVPPRGHDEHRTTRTSTTAGVDQVMKFRVAREVLADAVAWTARSLPPRPSVPVDRKSTRLNSSHANISYAVF